MDGLGGMSVAGSGSLSSDAKSGPPSSMITLFKQLQDAEDSSNQLMLGLASLEECLLGVEVQEANPEESTPIGPSIMDALRAASFSITKNLRACHRSYDRINIEVGSRP